MKKMMNKSINETLSERQFFRMSILENIAVPMMLVPYVAANAAEGMHFVTLLVGLFFFAVYVAVNLFLLSRSKDNLYDFFDTEKNITVSVIRILYILRFNLKSVILLMFFARVIKKYMLLSMNTYLVMGIFVIVCLLGAAGGLGKRARLMELLYLWMIIPLIIMGVFSITNVKFDENNEWKQEEIISENNAVETISIDTDVNEHDTTGILEGGYIILVLLSATELMSFSYGRVKGEKLINAVKINIWIIFSVLFSTFIILGILGEKLTGSDITAGFGVMEASRFPGGMVNRMDYLILTFWIIGLFSNISGYLFVSKKIMSNKIDESRKILILILIIIAFVTFLSSNMTNEILIQTVVYSDIALSIVSLAYIVIKNKKLNSKKISGLLSVLLVTALLSGCKKSYNNCSIEDRDYVKEFSVFSDDGEYIFEFEIVDLVDYKGDDGKTFEYTCSFDNLEETIKAYYEEEKKQLDLGHISCIYLNGSFDEYEKLLLEMGQKIYLSKSIKVIVNNDKEYILRDLIRSAYNSQ